MEVVILMDPKNIDAIGILNQSYGKSNLEPFRSSKPIFIPPTSTMLKKK